MHNRAHLHGCINRTAVYPQERDDDDDEHFFFFFFFFFIIFFHAPWTRSPTSVPHRSRSFYRWKCVPRVSFYFFVCLFRTQNQIGKKSSSSSSLLVKARHLEIRVFLPLFNPELREKYRVVMVIYGGVVLREWSRLNLLSGFDCCAIQKAELVLLASRGETGIHGRLDYDSLIGIVLLLLSIDSFATFSHISELFLVNDSPVTCRRRKRHDAHVQYVVTQTVRLTGRCPLSDTNHQHFLYGPVTRGTKFPRNFNEHATHTGHAVLNAN